MFFCNMRTLFFVALFLVGHFVYSQDTKVKIIKNINAIEKALVQKDTLVLNKLLHTDLTFGHSNGWIESKESLLNDLKNTKVIYTSFENISAVDFTFHSEDIVITRRKITAHGIFRQQNFSINMNVLEIWILNQDIWKLLARQSVNNSQ